MSSVHLDANEAPIMGAYESAVFRCNEAGAISDENWVPLVVYYRADKKSAKAIHSQLCEVISKAVSPITKELIHRDLM